MPLPIMCGVPSMAAASAWAGSRLSSYSILAFFVFQLTETDLIPLTRASDACTVLVQGGQCRPVIRYVAFVGGSSEYTFGETAKPRAIAARQFQVEPCIMILQR